MNHLWAPWRMEYLGDVRTHKETKGCVFCVLPSETNDRENLIVHRGKTHFVILNRFPYNAGHVMVVPNQHTNQLADLNAEAQVEMMTLTRKCCDALKIAYNAQGFNLGMNLGEAGGAGIREHLHMHIVPRWVGDTNFLPVIGETKAMPQYLLSTYDAVFAAFGKVNA